MFGAFSRKISKRHSVLINFSTSFLAFGLFKCLSITHRVHIFVHFKIEPPLDLRRLKLTLQYIVNLKQILITQPIIASCIHFMSLYDNNKMCIKSIGFRVQKHVEDSNFPLDIIHPFNNSKIPPWVLIKPDVDISLSEF